MERQIPIQVYESILKLNEDLFWKHFWEGDTEQTSKAWHRAKRALEQIDQYQNQASAEQAAKPSRYLVTLEVEGKDKYHDLLFNIDYKLIHSEELEEN